MLLKEESDGSCVDVVLSSLTCHIYSTLPPLAFTATENSVLLLGLIDVLTGWAAIDKLVTVRTTTSLVANAPNLVTLQKMSDA